jgi:polysaccharide pyruvyl transferase WcaK-like protein
MKIAVITLHRVFNYGSVLQAYATQKIFEHTGNDVEIIDYITEQRTLEKLLNEVPPVFNKEPKRTLYLILKSASIFIKTSVFGRFIKKNLNLTKRKYVSFKELCSDPPKADVYVTGSDQVWNSHYNEGIDKGFFLDFVPENKRRISYASSFGRELLDSEEVEETKQLLNKYSKISVREDTAVEILDCLGIKGSTCVLDPTLQLENYDWMKLAGKRIVKEPYLLLLLLYNEDSGATEYAAKIAEKKNLKVVKLSWELKRPNNVDILKTHRSPEKFLSMFQHADYVVTNSYHGLAFSINFNRQFLAVPRVEYNTRLESLLRLVGLEDRFIEEPYMIYKADIAIEYDKVNEILSAERKKAYDYIGEAVKQVIL